MRLRSLRLKGMGPFRDVTLDLDALPGTVVAVTGENGAGKTSLLELAFAGALYRSTPTQGTLGNRARGRDSLVEARIGDLLIRHHVDTLGSGKVLVKRDGAGRLEVESAGVRDYDRWASAHLPAKDLFYASVFGAQGSAGFLGLDRGDRMTVLLRALGLERVQMLAKRASERWASVRDAADAEAGKLNEARGRTQPVAAAEAALSAAATTLDAAHTAAEGARGALACAREAEAARGALLAQARAHQGRLDELGADRQRHEEQIGRATLRRRGLAALLGAAASQRALAAEVDGRRAELLELERAVAEAEDFHRLEASLLAEETHAAEVVTELERRLARAAEDISGRDGARSWAARAPGLRAAIDAAEQASREASQAAADVDRDSRAEAQAAERARSVVHEQRDRQAQALRRLSALNGVEEAEAALPDLRDAETRAQARRKVAQAEVTRLRTLLVDGKDSRLRNLRHGLDAIAVLDDCFEQAPRVAANTLTADNSEAGVLQEAPSALVTAQAEEEAAWAAEHAATGALRDAATLASRRPDLDAARTDRDGALATIEQAEAAEMLHSANAEDASAVKAKRKAEAEEHARTASRLRAELSEAERAERRLPDLARAEATIAGIEEQARAARAAREVAVSRVRALGEPPVRPADERVGAARNALARAEAAVARLPEIAAAEAASGELDAQVAADGAAVAAADERIAALGPTPSVPPAPDLAAATAAARAAEQAHVEAVTTHVRAEQALAAARETAGHIAALERGVVVAEQLAADWALVARGLGRDGVQALLIDAAGPELTSLVNDLLRACFGSRYTVTISTTRAKKDGSGDREVCDVLVYDAQHPEDGDREGREFSGGQRVIIGEAIACALNLLSMKRAGLKEVTPVRDETGAALDDENARAYVQMLRRFAELANAPKVLFVSHNPATWALADALVHVVGGAIEIRGAESEPRNEEARVAA